MGSDELRQKFLEFFKKRDHIVVPSSSLLPENDASVLFTTAGMQQFKRYYLFPDESPAARITTIQKCIRTGDIDEVGDDTHLTFFEMLGNFSFGYKAQTVADQTRTNAGNPYFKAEAIEFAWEFLTTELNFDISRLSANYFKGENGIPADLESFEFLKQITKLPADKITGTGFDETFWSLGTEGSPGGPTVEFYVDGIEIWNLVFNQYILKDGKYVESEFFGVDTGMGFERLLCVLNDQSDVYKTDLFVDIIKKIEELSDKKYADNIQAFRIIADHLRSAVALIADGVLASNKDQGYILRRLIRRAIVKGNEVGIKNNFTAEISTVILNLFQNLKTGSRNEFGMTIKTQDDIKNELEKEETKFRKNIESGLKIIESQKEYSGKILFDLYQSYGIPLEITIEEAENFGRQVPIEAVEEFNNLLLEHQNLSRTASAGMFKGGLADNDEDTKKLHTAAHLMLAALRTVLGDSVTQKGANITSERLRFDFAYPEKMTPEQIAEVERIVNEKIGEKLPVSMEEMPVADAKESGAMGVFDDRYGDKVKVYSIGNPSTSSGSPFSREICGGPHAENTGELGRFKIKKEESSSAGVRRIKAILE